MDFPPWLPTPVNTHAGRLVALARCIYSHHYLTENHRTKGLMQTFRDSGSGDLERTASVLHLAGFTEFLDEFGTRSVFVCTPDDFEAVANGEQAESVDPILVKEAVTRLASGRFRSTEEVEFLARSIEGDP